MTAAGIVRVARRPEGWQPPGPPPAAPADRLDLWPRPGEDLCCLTGDWRILQRLRGHRWSLDDLITAWAAAEAMEAPPRRVADLGCGIGSVLLMLAWRFPTAEAIGIEAQAESVALARRSIAWNGASARCQARHGDLRQAALLDGETRFDLVSGTPPYLPEGTACEPTRSLQAGCHLEQRGGIEDYCAAAARLLAPGGRFVVCHSSVERTERAASAVGLSIVSRLAVVPRASKPPLFSVFTMSPSPAAASSAEIVVRGADGQWTDAFRAVRHAMGMPDRPPSRA